MVKFYNVSVIYTGKKRALDNISMHIRKGEFVYITGPSGAGKTTLLKLIYCDLHPSEGVICVSNKDISRISSRSIPYLRRNVGVVYQDFKLIYDQSVFQNLSYALEIFYMSKKDISIYVESILKKLELYTKRNILVKHLSGGEKQRVAIARALINDPPIILLDEPTGNLDEKKADRLIAIIKEFFKEKTVIFATHDTTLIEKYPARILELKNGRLVFDSMLGNEEANISN
ncbi:MAG: ATP-binding cassette domain-containing protein [Deferribacterota bacterium]|nr:ATP-binding cassette domain-containing protein [Deferribacterota bacterium]